MDLLFQDFIWQTSFGQRPRQCLNRSYSNRIWIRLDFEELEFYSNKIYLCTDEVFDQNLICKIKS